MSEFSSQNLIESIGKIKKTLLLLHQYIVGGGGGRGGVEYNF